MCLPWPKEFLYVIVLSEQNTVKTLCNKLLSITEVHDETAEIMTLNILKKTVKIMGWKHK